MNLDSSSRASFASSGIAALNCAPVFIVGCPRSGTTLLRLMLDSHPSLAIPDESHFIVGLHRRWLAAPSPAETLEAVFGHVRFRRWGLDPADVRRLAAIVRPSSYSEVMATVFAAYAAANRKPRWGDKSPPYVEHIPLLAQLFPDAQFLHIIRDGREVARSLASQTWGPPTPVTGALFWKRRVSRGLEAGRGLPPERYLEVRLEQLIAEPERVLGEVCDFLHEPFAPEMLGYHQDAHPRVWSGDPAGPHRVDHRHLSSPPTPGLRDWRAGLSVAQQRALEAAAQPLLAELGYSAQRPSPAAILRVQADRLHQWLHGMCRQAYWRAGQIQTELRSVCGRRGQRPGPGAGS